MIKLKTSDLVPGDILIQCDGEEPDHALLWVGGEKPVVHNAEADDYTGVFQQSSKNIASNEEIVAIYRHKRAQLGQRAAEFARRWAVSSSDPRFALLKKKVKKNKIQTFRLSTTFNQERLTGGEDIPPWTVDSLTRVVSAYLSVRQKQPLGRIQKDTLGRKSKVGPLIDIEGVSVVEPEGLTCSQFVAFCYQAASLDQIFGKESIPSTLLRHIEETGVLLILANRNNNLLKGVAKMKEYLDLYVPRAFQLDVTALNVGQLNSALMADDSVELKGRLVPDV